MANLKISELPLYTGNTTGAYLVMNNSGQTTTYKVTKETLIGASGTSGTSGSSGSSGSSGATGASGTSGSSGSSGSSGLSGSSGTSGSSGSSGSSGTSGAAGASGSSGTSGSSGSSGTSGSSGDSLFALTGSVWNTTNNVGITGSLNISGSATYDVGVTGSMRLQNGTNAHSILLRTHDTQPFVQVITGSLSAQLFGSGLQLFSGNDMIFFTANSTTSVGNKTQLLTYDSASVLRTVIDFPCSSSWNNGLTKFRYPVEVTGSIKTTELLNIKPFYYGTGSIYGNNLQNVPGTTGDVRLFYTDGNLYNLAYFTVSGSNSWNAL